QNPPRHESTTRSGRESTPNVSPLDVDKIAVSVATKLQKPQRQITEIRIFFDDGTFETYGPH
ncbi:MAG: transcriptional regulator, partial [Bacteroidaceae bacterium]|nr:transcriptional regulator [Bacteroidaceae bacterium]